MGAHARRAVEDRLLQRRPGTGMDILDRHRVLDRGDARDRARVTPDLRRAAVDDAGFVEMDVGLDKAAADEAPAAVVGLGGRREIRLERDDASVGDADIERRRARRAGRRIGKPRIAKDQVHGHGFAMLWLINTGSPAPATREERRDERGGWA